MLSPVVPSKPLRLYILRGLALTGQTSILMTNQCLIYSAVHLSHPSGYAQGRYRACNSLETKETLTVERRLLPLSALSFTNKDSIRISSQKKNMARMAEPKSC